MEPITIFIIVAIVAAISFAGRLVGLFRQSREVEKTLDYSKMQEWEDEDDD